MLREALKGLESKELMMVQKCVAKKLLSLGQDIPQWLLATYKVMTVAMLDLMAPPPFFSFRKQILLSSSSCI